jgi:pre-rRNA-processing protein IPI3
MNEWFRLNDNNVLKFQVTLDRTDANSFAPGHSGAVKTLSVSADGLTVASGSDDHDVRLWHVRSRQCIKTIVHKGPVTVARFLRPPRSMLEPDCFKPGMVLAQLRRTVTKDEVNEDNVEIVVRKRLRPEVEDDEDRAEQQQSQNKSNGSSSSSRRELLSDGDEVKKLKEANLGLYRFAANKLMLNGK